MTILCIETSTAVCSAALCADGQVIKQYINREGSNHARLLPTYIEQLLADARTQGLTIDAVALSEGPGSYTGLRIGTSTAKGLCYGLNVPLIPVPTLEVLCEAAKEKLEVRGERMEVFCPMIDARRMEVYAALFSAEVRGENLEEKGNKARAIVVENEESLYTGEKDVYYFGDGAAKCQAVLTKPNWHFVPDIVPEAQFVGKIAVTDERLRVTGDGLQVTGYGLRVTDERLRVTGEQIAYYEPYYLKEFVAAQSHVKGLIER